jgi:methylamine dehydrogenase heavy chain
MMNAAVVARKLVAIAASSAAMAAVGASAATDKPALPVERSDVAVLPPASPHRLIAIGAFGGSATVFDADDPAVKSLGTIPVRPNAITAMTRDGATVVVAETFWSHDNRGERSDVLSLYDGLTLKLTHEIPIPGHLHVVPKTQVIALSDDDKLAYIYDMLPASSVHVVDLAQSQVITSVPLPGCALAFAFGKRGFGTLCGDGTVGSVDLTRPDAPAISFTQPVFDPDNDPIFENSVVDRATGRGWFLSYTGKIYPVQFGEGAPAVGESWSLAAAAGLREATTGVQDLAWRPGGGQLIALHRPSQRLFVLMHPGNHWTHKAAGTELWVVDARTKEVTRRIPLKEPGHNVAVSQDDEPLLYVFGEAPMGGMAVIDANSGEALRGRPATGGAVIMVPGW